MKYKIENVDGWQCVVTDDFIPYNENDGGRGEVAAQCYSTRGAELVRDSLNFFHIGTNAQSSVEITAAGIDLMTKHGCKKIALACNHHEELVAQLEAVTERLGAWMTIADPDDVTDEDKQSLVDARSLLTKLKG